MKFCIENGMRRHSREGSRTYNADITGQLLHTMILLVPKNPMPLP